jgi:hypothetical protein
MIAAAIKVLEDFKESGTQGDWEILDGGDRFVAWHEDPASTGFDYVVAEPIEFENPVDPVLIVTLHRTIDAQLDFLREAQAWAVNGHESTLPQKLARAILGEAAL